MQEIKTLIAIIGKRNPMNEVYGEHAFDKFLNKELDIPVGINFNSRKIGLVKKITIEGNNVYAHISLELMVGGVIEKCHMDTSPKRVIDKLESIMVSIKEP